MEVAAFSLGALALISTFKDCIDIFNMIATARSLGNDASILNTKLDVEKLLFLQWADRVGLMDPNEYDPRLNDPAMRNTVDEVLSGIRDLFSDSTAVKKRYGLDSYQESRHEVETGQVFEEQASSSRMSVFLDRFERLSIKHKALRSHMKSQGHSALDQFRWVVRDKEKFESLIRELTYFNSRLDALLPRQAQSVARMTEEDLAHLRSIPKLKMILQAAMGSQPEIASAARKAIIRRNQSRVLERLWFRWIDDRKANIHDKHSRTLEWALNPPDGDMRWNNLCQWLKEQSGIYWLAGKAGSGKSTLMKHLCDHPRTRELLDEWSDGAKLISAQFFFYTLGRAEQKSHEGLLRALLFQILDTEPGFIETVLPNMWREAINTEDKEEFELAMPSRAEMQNALLGFSRVAVGMRFWFLIDGLDEFEGRHSNAASFFRRLGQYPNVKILLSSRPLPDFVAEFSGGPKMNLQDLTQADIAAYIDDTITRHQYMAQLSRLDDQIPMEISKALLMKSSGVFLWVALACRSILDGFAAFDSISELEARIDELPPELEDLFDQMLSSIDMRWREQGAKLLHLVFDNQTRSVLDPIPTIGLALVDGQGLRADFRGSSVGILSEEEMVLRCQILEGRLRSRCAGLLEISRPTSGHQGPCVCSSEGPRSSHAGLLGMPHRRGPSRRSPGFVEHNTLLDSHVVFIHRSFYEFMCSREIGEWKSMQIPGGISAFCSYAVLGLLWSQLPGLHPWNSNISLKDISVKNFLANAISAEAEAYPPLLTTANLSRFLSWLGPTLNDAKIFMAHRVGCEAFARDESLVLALAAEIGLERVVQFSQEEPIEFNNTLIPATVTRNTLREDEQCGNERNNGVMSNCQCRNRTNLGRPGSRAHPTVMPLLYHAVCQPLFRKIRRLSSNINWVSANTNSTAMVRYLLETGHDPNEEFFHGDAGSVTTPWIRWLKVIGLARQDYTKNDKRQNYSEATCAEILEKAEITKLFVDTKAMLGQPGTKMFKLVSSSLSRYILQAVKRRRYESIGWAVSDKLWIETRDTINERLSVEIGPGVVLRLRTSNIPE